jgi:hypothetical protein
MYVIAVCIGGLEPFCTAPCVYRPSTLHRDKLSVNSYGANNYITLCLEWVSWGWSGRSKLVGGCVISGLCRDVVDTCVLLGFYAAYSGNSLRTFRHNVSVRSSGVKKFKRIALPLKIGPIGCAETSLRNYYHTLRKNPVERRSHVWGIEKWLYLWFTNLYFVISALLWKFVTFFTLIYLRF